MEEKCLYIQEENISRRDMNSNFSNLKFINIRDMYKILVRNMARLLIKCLSRCCTQCDYFFQSCETR